MLVGLGRPGVSFNGVRTHVLVPPLLALLASCSSSSAEGAPMPVPLVSSTQAIAQTPSRLLIPENIPPGAATAIFEYFRLLNLALETGRTTELEAFVAWDCPSLTPVPAIHAIYRDGLLIGAKDQILRMSLISKDQDGATVQVESVRSQATQVTNSTGTRTILAEHRNTTDFILENFSDVWLLMSSKLPQ
jgi:hypothetical protein